MSFLTSLMMTMMRKASTMRKQRKTTPRWQFCPCEFAIIQILQHIQLNPERQTNIQGQGKRRIWQMGALWIGMMVSGLIEISHILIALTSCLFVLQIIIQHSYPFSSPYGSYQSPAFNVRAAILISKTHSILTINSMNQPQFVFHEEQSIGQAHQHLEQKPRAPQMELEGGYSQSLEHDNTYDQPPQDKKGQFHYNHPQQPTRKHHKHNLSHRKRQRRHEAKLVSDEEDKSGDFGDDLQLKAVHHMLPPPMAKQRKKSTTFEEKADLFHSAQPSEIKPNLLVPQEASSPLHVKNEHLFTLKPHQEHPIQYQPYNQESRTHQLQQNTYHHHGKKRKESIDAQQPEYTLEKKNAKKLPAISSQAEGRYQQGEKNPIAIKQSSIIVLHSSDKPKEQPHAESFHHLQLEAYNSLEYILKPLEGQSTYTFGRDCQHRGSYFHPHFELFGQQQTSIISAQKQWCHWNSHYILTSSHNQQEIGILKGNFGGTKFNLYETYEGSPQLVATIIYKSDCSCGQTSRDLSVFIKSSRQADPAFQRETLRKNLQELFEQGYTNEILELKSKQPVWNQKLQCFVLKFRGKGTHPSVKNMILVSSNDQKSQSLIFYKRGAHTFHLQLCAPLSIFVGMGILMSSFDFKLLCQ